MELAFGRPLGSGCQTRLRQSCGGAVGLGHRMFVDDATGNEPKHYDPSQALQQEELEACEADGLEPQLSMDKAG